MLDENLLLDLLAFLSTYFICILVTRFSVAQPVTHAEAYRNVSECIPQVSTLWGFCLWGNSKQWIVVRLANLCLIWGQNRWWTRNCQIFFPPQCEIQKLSNILLNLGPQLTKSLNASLDSRSASGASSHQFFAHSYTKKDHQKRYRGETRSSHSSTTLTDLGRFPRLWSIGLVGKYFQKSEADPKLLRVTVWPSQKCPLLGCSSTAMSAQGSSPQTRQPLRVTRSAKSFARGWLVHIVLAPGVLQRKKDGELTLEWLNLVDASRIQRCFLVQVTALFYPVTEIQYLRKLYINTDRSKGKHKCQLRARTSVRDFRRFGFTSLPLHFFLGAQYPPVVV